MRRGPKGPTDETPLPPIPHRTRDGQDLTETQRFQVFCRRYITTPKGSGAKQAFRLRPFQSQELVPTLLDGTAKLIVWSVPRGQGKSTLVAALGLYHVFCSGVEGARAVIVAQDERSSRRMIETASRMVALNEELSKRCKVYIDRIEVPATKEALIFSVARLVVWTGGAGVRDDGAWTVRSPVSLISSTAIVGGSLAVSGS